MRVFGNMARGRGLASATRPGRRGRIVALVGTALFAIPMVSLGAHAAARGARSEAAPRVCANGTYTVLSGDSWSRISSRLHVKMGVLLKANTATTGMVIHPGDLVCLPAGVAPVVPVTFTAPATTPLATTPSATTPSATTPLGPLAIRQFPVQGVCWFTDSYGAPRSGGRRHEGVDIIAKTGQLIYAADDGTLTKIYMDAPGANSGNGWRLTRADATYYFYGHMSAFAAGLKVGSVVKAGQILGKVGMTGNAGTPHLHFEVHPGGGPAVNPTPVVRPVNGCSTSVVPQQPGAEPSTTAPTTAPTTTTEPRTTATTTASTTATTTAPTTATTTATTTPTTTPTTPVTTVVPIVENVAPSLWQFVSPVVVFDSGGARLVPGRQVPVTLPVLKGVTPSTTGVLVRVVARNVAGSGHLAVRPCSGVATTTTTLSFAPGQPNATTTIVPVTAGSFCVVASAAIDVRISVVAAQSSSGVGMQPITAKRALDTRTSSAIAAGASRAVTLSALGAPSGSKAVTATFTLLGATKDGSIGVGACGGTPWIIPFKARPTLVFSGVVAVNDTGLCITSTVQAHVVVDSTGAWSGRTTLGATVPLRLFDSRTSAAISTVPSTFNMAVPVGMTRAQLTITVLGGTGAGVLRVWNCADPTSAGSVVQADLSSVISVTAGMNVTGGALCISSLGNAHAIVDLTAIG